MIFPFAAGVNDNGDALWAVNMYLREFLKKNSKRP
jgi:hypothetical protein